MTFDYDELRELMQEGTSHASHSRIMLRWLNKQYDVIDDFIAYVETVGVPRCMSVNRAYEQYCEWCLINKKEPVSKVKHGKLLKERFGVESKPFTINGKSIRLYGK